MPDFKEQLEYLAYTYVEDEPEMLLEETLAVVDSVLREQKQSISIHLHEKTNSIRVKISDLLVDISQIQDNLTKDTSASHNKLLSSVSVLFSLLRVRLDSVKSDLVKLPSLEDEEDEQ